ncbi:AsmA-like C-terminal region-containing protein [Ancylomarina sp. 16SWW S1-10-2]|uniref:AsmA-like C-terminal region-containing protein n=1 Tax=Ancylomarina sp. 16SWW S1-10-2 TaxID=2499681 RepID=UPI00189F2938|nr:AsmA-like C-terminal region-containing protein [Ancylomarina sp. 16SWW S1-10-2]
MQILKKVGTALLVLVFVLIIAAAIGMWYLFTPEKLTPIVNKQAKEYLDCNTNVEKVEPTFFGTYPFLGLEITNLCLTEKTNTSKTDTLLYTPKCFASLNVMSYLFGGNIKLDPFLIEDGYLNFKIDSLGHSNFDILKSSSDSSEANSEVSFGDIDISNVEFKNFNAKYTDESTFRKADISNLNAKLELNYSKEKQNFGLDMQLDKLLYTTSDSMALFVEAQNCNLKINSKAKDANLINSDLKLICKAMSVSMAGDTILSNMKLDSNLPFNANLSENSYDFKKSELIINDEQAISFNGKVNMLEDNSISTNISYSTNELNIENILALVPKAYSDQLKDIKAKGYAKVSGSVTGLMSETSTPLLTTNIEYSKGEIKYTGYPTVKDIKLSMSTKVDLNKNQNSNITVNSSSAKILNSAISVKGNISDILGIPQYDIYSKSDLNLADFKSFIPKDQNIIIQGLLNGNLHTQFSQSDIDKEAYHRIYLTGDFNTQNFDAIYDDTIKVNLPSGKIKLNLPSQTKADKNLLFAKIKIDAPNSRINMSPTMSAATQNLELSVDINQLAKDVSAPISFCHFKFDSLYAIVDTISVSANNATGQFEYAPTLKAKQEIALINSTINSQKFEIISKDSILFDAKKLYAKTNLKYDESQNNVILKWQPEMAISFSDAIYDLGKQLKGEIPNMSFTLDPDTMVIKKVDLTLGDSDFSLTGKLTDITKYLNDQALLKGNFDLISQKTDVYQLMDIFNGMGSQDSTLASNETVSAEDDPFMVPKGVEIRLNSTINQTVVNDNIIKNIKGGLTVKDGTLILDQMGFTSKAANMQLTAMYRSDRKNHLFSGIDFHLLDIDIAELIALIPSVNTMIPMLKSFKGKGEFHLAGETYLKSDYSLKQSTIRGAAAFQGQELTLMDTETFDMIANKLMFKKKTVNVIDSLSVEMTLFKDEIDVYPFLIVMDNYKAVISGRHNMDNSFNYHISVTDTPLPVRLGLNVTGTIDDLKYNLVDCKYKHLYNPKKQGAMESQTLRLKKLISESLKKSVKEF